MTISFMVAFGTSVGWVKAIEFLLIFVALGRNVREGERVVGRSLAFGRLRFQPATLPEATIEL